MDGEITTSIINGLGGYWILITALVTFLSRVQSNRIRDREQETFKKEFQSQSHEFNEKLKSIELKHQKATQLLEHELIIERHEAQLGRAKVIEKQTDIIDQSYKHLVALHETVQNTIRPDIFLRESPPLSQIYEDSLPLFDIFVSFFESNKIYFSPFIADRVSDFYVLIDKALTKARVVINSRKAKNNNDINDHLNELFEVAILNTNKARVEIETQFRMILKTSKT